MCPLKIPTIKKSLTLPDINMDYIETIFLGREKIERIIIAKCL